MFSDSSFICVCNQFVVMTILQDIFACGLQYLLILMSLLSGSELYLCKFKIQIEERKQ